VPRAKSSVVKVREIWVDPQPLGTRVVYLVETRSPQEEVELDALFAEMSSYTRVCQLCKGKLMSFVLQVEDSDTSILDETDYILRANYAFVVTQRSFDMLIYRIVEELCRDTGSELLPLPHCNICGDVEPFPNTVVSLSDDDGSVVASRSYCVKCTAQTAAPSNKELIRSLLDADEHDFSKLKNVELVRLPSHKHPIRFRVR